MSNYKKFKPLQEVRLREWPPARVNQLKLVLGHLQAVANNALAAQVEQSEKRQFSEFVPKIILSDDNVDVEFQEIRIKFDAPQGIERFLFYEYQLSDFQFFNNFETVTTPEGFATFSGLQDAQTYYIRVRVVTTDGLFGPWSETITATTPFASAQMARDTNAAWTVELDSSFTSFRTIYAFPIVNIDDGTIFYMIDYETYPKLTSGDASFHWSDVEFRWVVDNDQQGQSMAVSSYGRHASNPNVTATGNVGSVTFTSQAYKRTGTLIQKPHLVSAASRVLIKLQARRVNYHPTVNELNFSTSPTYITNTIITLSNFNVFLIRTGPVT